MDKRNEKETAESAEATRQDATPDSAPEGGAVAAADPELEKLKREKTELYERLLRKQAELDNFRKRTQREKEEFVQHATGDLIRALLPVLDGFERALAHRETSTPEQFLQGVELIHRELVETLNRAGVSAIVTEGATFDPHFHQAVETVASPGHHDQEIVEELQRGYRLRNRLLRPAIVKVAVEEKAEKK
jgi:molecular chaperone GrpE